MADRDTLASTHGYSTCVTFPFSGAWAQADLQHIGGFFRKPLAGAPVALEGYILYAPARSFTLSAPTRTLTLDAPIRTLILFAHGRSST